MRLTDFRTFLIVIIIIIINFTRGGTPPKKSKGNQIILNSKTLILNAMGLSWNFVYLSIYVAIIIHMDTMTNNNNAILLVLLINKKVQQKIFLPTQDY